MSEQDVEKEKRFNRVSRTGPNNNELDELIVITFGMAQSQ